MTRILFVVLVMACMIPGHAQEDNKTKVTRLLGLIFDGGVGDRKPASIQARIESMNKNTEALLALDRSDSKSPLNRYLIRVQKYAADAQGFYPGLKKICLERTDAALMAVDFYVFQYYQAYWDAAQKIFPGEAAFSQTYSLATTILAELGSVDKLATLAAKNYEQKVNDTRLPEPKVNDKALEKLFMEAYDKMYSVSFSGKAIKAIILSDDWTIQRNEVSGIVTGRLRKGAVVYKNADGKCFLIKEFYIQQEYVGNSFAGTKSVYAVGKGQEMRCENVK